MRCDVLTPQTHVYFGSGLDNKALKSSLEIIEQNTAEMKAKMNTMLSKIDATFKLIVNTTEITTPRMFLVIPDPAAKSWKNPSSWGKNTFRMHLLCECPAQPGWHFTDHEGYPMLELNTTLKKAAPYLKWVLKAVQIAGSAASSVTMGGSQAASLLAGHALAHLENPLEQFGFIESMIAKATGTNPGEEEPVAVLGPALRELEQYLIANDAAKAYGNLYRHCYETGDVKWLCRDHNANPPPLIALDAAAGQQSDAAGGVGGGWTLGAQLLT